VAVNIDDTAVSLKAPIEFGIIAENMALFTPQEHLVDGTSGFMASIYVFMFEYPNKLNN
jgi:hypothetical protein